MIGVITSPTGAVIRDILHRLAERFPRRVLVWPVTVQGDGSAAEVAAAIAGFNALARARRGAAARPASSSRAAAAPSRICGRSTKRSWCARRPQSRIPLISAVGHETDTTLIDFVADRRAPTPTAAAEMAVPVRAELMVDIGNLSRRALACWRRNQEARRSELRSAARALPDADEVLALPRQRLDHAAAGLRRALRANAHIHRVSFSQTAGRLSSHLLRNNVERRRERYAGVAQRLRASAAANLEAYRTRIARQREQVGSLAKRAGLAMDNYLEARWARCERDAQAPRRLLLSQRSGSRLYVGARQSGTAHAHCCRARAWRANRDRIRRRQCQRASRGRADDAASGAGAAAPSARSGPRTRQLVLNANHRRSNRHDNTRLRFRPT